MGGALLLLQGAVALCWLLGAHGARGGAAALLIFALAWAVEHVGVTAGMPFGRYTYTGALQPQLFDTVPLAIPCAWLMVAVGAWQLATSQCGDAAMRRCGDRKQSAYPLAHSPTRPLAFSRRVVPAATLVLLLDLQIETVTTRINQYWIWLDSGPYYGVPTANFVAWWLVGLLMASIVAIVLPPISATTFTPSNLQIFKRSIIAHIPAHLYLLSTLMFAIVNLAHGYILAGLIGVLVLLAAALAARPIGGWRPLLQRVEPAERAD
jgi:putative membrane protein